MFLKYTYVDSITGVSIVDQPATNGPAVPDVQGLVFDFALESEYPSATPTFFGKADDDADATVGGILAELSEEEYEEARKKEMDRRAEIAAQTVLNNIVMSRKHFEQAGFVWKGVFIDTTEASYTKILGGRAAAKDELRTDGDIWKCGDPETGEVIYRATSNEEMIEIGDLAFKMVQDCFNRESALVAAVKDGSYTDAMLYEGWPA